MKKENVTVTGVLRQTEEFARRLVCQTLVRPENPIDIVAVKISPDDSPNMASIGYRCTILLRTARGATLRSEARDCDEMLAVYSALSNIVDGVAPEQVTDGSRKPLNDKYRQNDQNLEPIDIQDYKP